ASSAISRFNSSTMSSRSSRLTVSDRTVQLVHETPALAHVTGAAVRTFAVECPKSRQQLLPARIGTEEAHELNETMTALIAEQVLHLAAINLGLSLGHAEDIHQERLHHDALREDHVNDLRALV